MLNLKYKLYRTKKLKKLTEMTATAGRIWNHCVALQQRYFRMYGKYVGLYRMQKHIAKLRNKNPYWKVLTAQSVQELIERVDTAYQRFFKKIAKRPAKFKKSKDFKSFVFKQNGFKIENNVLTISKVGRYKFSLSRPYSNVKRVTIKRDAVGDYWIVLTCDIKSDPYYRARNGAVGIDFGLKTYLTLSNGESFESPLFFKTLSKDIASVDRRLSKAKVGSNTRQRAKSQRARLYRHLTGLRSDYQWKLAHELCSNYDFIALEDLNIEGMKRMWGRKVSDLSHSSFIEKLHQVALKYGTTIQKVGRFFPSSKLCNDCNMVKKELKLSDRVYTCNCCGSVLDRDLNASKNILTEGIRLSRSLEALALNVCTAESHVL